jgi:hypothetical protein
MNPRCSPQTGSQSPSLGRECGSADRSDSRPVGVSTVGPSAAKPITMPSHDGVPLHEYQRRAPVPPDSSQADPKQSVARLEVRALGCARLIAVSCCRSARFSKTNSRCPRSANACARAIAMSSSNIRRSRRASARKRGRVLARVSRRSTRCVQSETKPPGRRDRLSVRFPSAHRVTLKSEVTNGRPRTWMAGGFVTKNAFPPVDYCYVFC